MKVMIVGYGSAGKYALDYILRLELIEDNDIIIATRSVEEARKDINLSLVSAGIQEYYPREITIFHCDLNDMKRTTALIDETEPDLIIQTARFIKGLKYGAFSHPRSIGYGAWVPLAIPLVYKLMKAVFDSRANPKVVNTSFPDAVCPALASIGLAPWTGAGNLNHLIPRIKYAIMDMIDIYPTDLDVYLVGSHYLNTVVSKTGTPGGSPYYLEVRMGKEKLDLNHQEIFARCKLPMPAGAVRNKMIAADVTYLTEAFLWEKETNIHLPGVNGLIGGYPCFINYRKEIKTAHLDITLEEMIEINEKSLRWDGIDKIENGRIFFTPDLIDKMFTEFGIAYPVCIHVDDCEEFAIKLQKKLESVK